MKMDCLNKNNLPSAVIKEERSPICLTCIVVWVYVLFFSSTIRWATVQTAHGLIIEAET